MGAAFMFWVKRECLPQKTIPLPQKIFNIQIGPGL
jgi:hypothetical protein